MAVTENRLSTETSPYLRQHRNDPVDWYPWGEEAFARARELDRPLFLSIGYSACHWCHVMAHESFSDPATAAEMAETVVAVKIDREERPDVDSIYMEAVQAATGHGGWPMSVFATPDGRPFFAGTYFPNTEGRGSPTFRAVLAAVADAWADKRELIDEQADALRETVARRLAPLPAVDSDGEVLSGSLDAAGVRRALRAACVKLGEIHDPVHGGFGRSPKFPQPLLLDLLLVAHAEGVGTDLDPSPLEIVERTLEAMASGGIWDHVGGGFSRYSVDREWAVPHFEKMLYDQALLGKVYLHAWQLTGDSRWRQVLDELVGYTLRDLGLPSGGLATAEDADSEGEEGLFYTWTPAEIREALGPELGEEAIEWWGVTESGNFEGRNILHRVVRGDLERPAQIERARIGLMSDRAGRIRPGLDDKVLTETNAMMCATLAEAALATQDESFKSAAETIGHLVWTRLFRSTDRRVLRSLPPHEGDKAPLLGYSLDAAWVVEAYVRLAECTGQRLWLSRATVVAEQLLGLFEDRDAGGLFTTGNDAEELVVRPRELYDNVTPSATSVAAASLARLATLTAREDLAEAARRLALAGALLIERTPTAVPGLLAAANYISQGTVEIVVTGQRPDLVAEAGRRFLPRRALAWIGSGEEHDDGTPLPTFQGKPSGFGYVCRFGACRLPSATVAELAREIHLTVTGEFPNG